MAAYVKSLFWLIGASALGYTLLLVTTPDEKIITEKFPETQTSDAVKKRQAIVDILRQATESKNPMYRQTKEEIDSELHKK